MPRAVGLILFACVACEEGTAVPRVRGPAPEQVLEEIQAAMRAGKWEVVYDHLPDFVRVEWTARFLELGATRPPSEAAREDLRRRAEPVLSRIADPSAERALESAIEGLPDRRTFFTTLVDWMRKHDVHVYVLDAPKRRHVRLLDWLAEPGDWKVMSLRDSGSPIAPRRSAVVQIWDGERMKEDDGGFLLLYDLGEERWAVWPLRREPPLADDQDPPDVFEARACCILYTQLAITWRERRGRAPRDVKEVAADPPPSTVRFTTVDPWGNDYRLVLKGDDLRICSAGPDGRWETADDIVPRTFSD